MSCLEHELSYKNVHITAEVKAEPCIVSCTSRYKASTQRGLLILHKTNEKKSEWWGIMLLLQAFRTPFPLNTPSLQLSQFSYHILILPRLTPAATQRTAAHLAHMPIVSQPAEPVAQTLHPATEPPVMLPLDPLNRRRPRRRSR